MIEDVLYKIPSKSFVFGEYAVLKNTPALIAVGEEYFLASQDSNADSRLILLDLHPQSPAGRLKSLCLKFEISLGDIFFFDPHQGRGGFGKSTAEFIAVTRCVESKLQTESSKQKLGLLFKALNLTFNDEVDMRDSKVIWKIYRGIHKINADPLPSGADLVAQNEGAKLGKATFIQVQTESIKVDLFDMTSDSTPNLSHSIKSAEKAQTQKVENPAEDAVCFTLFSVLENPQLKFSFYKTPWDEPTHEHLKKLQVEVPDFRNLKNLSNQNLQFFKTQNFVEIPRALQSYREELELLGLQDLNSLNKAKDLELNAGVLMAKGCGALGKDVILVVQKIQTKTSEIGEGFNLKMQLYF